MKTNTCRFFNGIQNDKCKAGIAYDSFKPERIPCIKEYSGGYKPENLAHCDSYTEPSAEEIAKSKAELESAMERLIKAFPIINKVKTEHRGESWEGVEPCPVCGGKLHLSHAACNGHVWGRCETENCLAWME